MKLDKANDVAEDVVKLLKPFSYKIEICGSIRRKKPDVHDIDLVVIPNPEFYDEIKRIFSSDSFIRFGEKIIQLKHEGCQVDIYIATTKSFSVLKLIRTGSAEHNMKLCSMALARGMRLRANGIGLCDGNGYVIADTERKILTTLLGKYIEPEDRD